MLDFALLFAAAVVVFAPQAPASDGAAPMREIKSSLTPGYTTRISFSDALMCPESILMLMPEKATRTAIRGIAHPQCAVDAKGRISQCSKSEEVGVADLYWQTASAAMAEKCKVSAPSGIPGSNAYTFKFETR